MAIKTITTKISALMILLTTATTPLFASDAGPLPSDEQASEQSAPPTISVGLRLGLWASFADAEASALQSQSSSASEVQGSLQLDELIAVPQIEVFIRSRYLSLYVDAFAYSTEADMNVDVTTSFAGLGFEQGTRVELDIELRSLGARLEITPFPFDFMELGLTLGLRYFDIEGQARSKEAPRDELFGAGTPTSASERIQVPLPGLGLSLRIPLGAVEIYAHGQGIALDFDFDGGEYSAEYVEAEAGLALNINAYLAVRVGYRILSVDLTERKGDEGDGQRNQYELLQHGPTLSLQLGF